MITNRDIVSERLLHRTLDEVVASARENGVPDAALAAALRDRAARLEEAHAARTDGNGTASGTGTASGNETGSRTQTARGN